jgi:hypothetical protein
MRQSSSFASSRCRRTTESPGLKPGTLASRITSLAIVHPTR